MLNRRQLARLKVTPEAEHYVDVYEQLYRCPKCGFRNLGHGNFCTACGAPFTDLGVELLADRIEEVTNIGEVGEC